jgi:hypothetical protein
MENIIASKRERVEPRHHVNQSAHGDFEQEVLQASKSFHLTSVWEAEHSSLELSPGGVRYVIAALLIY